MSKVSEMLDNYEKPTLKDMSELAFQIHQDIYDLGRALHSEVFDELKERIGVRGDWDGDARDKSREAMDFFALIGGELEAMFRKGDQKDRTAKDLLDIAKKLEVSLRNVDQYEEFELNQLSSNREDLRVVLWLISSGRVHTITLPELEEEIKKNAEVRKDKL